MTAIPLSTSLSLLSFSSIFGGSSILLSLKESVVGGAIPLDRDDKLAELFSGSEGSLKLLSLLKEFPSGVEVLRVLAASKRDSKLFVLNGDTGSEGLSGGLDISGWLEVRRSTSLSLLFRNFFVERLKLFQNFFRRLSGGESSPLLRRSTELLDLLSSESAVLPPAENQKVIVRME